MKHTLPSIGLILALGCPVMGQQPAEKRASSPAPSTTTETMGEVVVTAEVSPFAPPTVNLGVLGDRDLLDVPFTIQRYDRQLLEKQQARIIRDILVNDASVVNQTTNSSYGSAINIRGFEAYTYFLDGLLGPITSHPSFPVFLIESADVLKGPSSVIFGGSSPSGGIGGSVNFQPKRAPQGDEAIRTLTLGWQNRNSWLGNIDLGGRFGSEKQFGYRFNMGGEYGELTARNAEQQDHYFGLSLDWKPTDSVKFTADLGHIRMNTDHYLDVLSVPAFGLPAPPDPSVNYSLPWNTHSTQSDYALLKAEFELAKDWSFEIAGAYSEARDLYEGGSLVEIQNLGGDALLSPNWYDNEDSENWSFRANLKGKFETLGLRHDISFSARYDSLYGGGSYGGYVGGPFAANIYRGIPNYAKPARLSESEGYYSDYAVTSFQVSDFIEVTPWLSLLAGGGYVNIEEQLQGYQQDAFTPLGAVILKPWEHTSFYVGYGEALEQGGIAPLGTSNFGQALPPKASSQIEAGIRHKWDRLNFGLSAFQIDRTLENVNAANAYVQDGEQTHRGMELSIGGDLTPDLSLLASAAFIDSEVNGSDTATRGNHAPGVPKAALRLFAEYRFTDLLPGFALNAGFNYKSSQYLSAVNDRSIPSYTTFDLGASYDLKPQHGIPAVLRLNIENLANESYYSAVSFGGFGLGVGEARTVKLSVQYNF